MQELIGPIRRLTALALGGAALASCAVGKIGDAQTDTSAVRSPGTTEPTGPAACVNAGTAGRVRRLTRVEYDKSVSDLLGEELHPSKDFPLDSAFDGYTNQADALVVSPLLAESLNNAATTLSTNAVGKLATLAPCSTAGDDACARTFIADFGKKAYRRPLEADEVDELFGVYQAGKDGGDFKSGIGLMLQVVFQSPSFLYKTELGDGVPRDDGNVLLAPHEIASEISFLITGRAPDTDLVAAAEGGMLADAGAREAQARRLLDTAEGREQMGNFIFQWVGIDRIEQAEKDKGIFPEWTPDVATTMRHETQAFAEEVIFNGDGTVSSLLTAPFTFVDSTLAQLYGLPPVTAFGKVSVDATQRAGLLTQGSVLATFAQSTQDSPIRRGKFVRTRILCETLPNPPKNLMIMPPPPSTTNTTRERFKAHATGGCYGCHRLMDPIGFGFENFDGIGRYRTKENGFDVDATGNLTDTMDSNGPFTGVVELAERLSKSAEVRACVSKNWFQFAMARSDEPADRCTLDAAFSAFNSGGQSMKDLVVDIVRADEFVLRAPILQ
jgi:Protein of unknown function (DUF1592)/Protein of unknown function (DUF1588)/Protein of unknown function (DUF1595)/Protein of unknown function (DUF1587)/Protein of unknown function (DUF1585)